MAMTDHDALCLVVTYCICDELAQARADERERIARAIEEAIGPRTPRNDSTTYLYGHADGWRDGASNAARIARGEV